jgi:hypothetical protein
MTDLITLPRAAVQQALEAWEYINKYGFVLADYEGPMEQAITALKAALEQPEPRNQCGETCERAKLCAVCAKGLEQPEQAVPVAWIQPDHLHKARQAPFLCRVEPTKRMSDFVAIYTHPPRREWQGLTDEEIKNAVGASAEFWATSALWIKSVARAVEAAHGIKENT